MAYVYLHSLVVPIHAALFNISYSYGVRLHDEPLLRLAKKGVEPPTALRAFIIGLHIERTERSTRPICRFAHNFVN